MHLEANHVMRLGLLFVTALWAGAQNQLAGGGSFITLPALMLTGMDARAANITSTVALFPCQVACSWLRSLLILCAVQMRRKLLSLVPRSFSVC